MSVSVVPMNTVLELENSSAAFFENPLENVPDQSWETPQPVDKAKANVLMNALSEPETPPTSTIANPVSKDSGSWLPLNHVSSAVREPMSGAKKFRKMLFETKELIVCPGVYDGLSARTAIELGFHAMYMVSLSLKFRGEMNTGYSRLNK
jgi:hypothetical protein